MWVWDLKLNLHGLNYFVSGFIGMQLIHKMNKQVKLLLHAPQDHEDYLFYTSFETDICCQLNTSNLKRFGLFGSNTIMLYSFQKLYVTGIWHISICKYGVNFITCQQHSVSQTSLVSSAILYSYIAYIYINSDT